MSYVVRTDIFEGPLDLLLTLIEKRKLFINDVSLAQVSDDFIGYVEEEKKKGFPMEQIADFLVVASTLLLIKSKSLLPSLDLSEEEEGSIEDLERRLRLYKRFRTLSRQIKEQFGKQVLFFRDVMPEHPVFSPHKSITQKNLHDAVSRVLSNLPKEADSAPEARVKQVISIEEMVDRLSNRIGKTLNLSFKEFSGMGREEKVTVIVGFLAMLELVKQGLIAVRQERMFSDIMMESEQVGTPKYTP